MVFWLGAFGQKCPSYRTTDFDPQVVWGKNFGMGRYQNGRAPNLGLFPGGSGPSRDQTVDFGSKIMILERDFEI